MTEDGKYVIERRQADHILKQIKTSSIRLVSVKRTQLELEEGEVACEAVEVTFEVYSTMAPDFFLTQIVPLPEHSSEMDGYLDQVVDVAKAGLKQRLDAIASLLESRIVP